MHQVIVKKGKVFDEEIPSPNVSKGSLLIKVVRSCISSGTEVSNVKVSGMPLIKRAMEQPENVKKVLGMVRNEGLEKAILRVKGKLDGGNLAGYSISGVVIAVGEEVRGFTVGDRVAAAGAGYANHAEYVDVPQNLVMHMHENLSFEDASTVTLGGIAMQGVRRADVTLGEFCVVYGAGVLGLLAIRMLALSGVRVVAIDIDDERLALSRQLGANMVVNAMNEDVVNAVNNFTDGRGADCVLFAAATASDEPLSKAFQMCRKKGRVVMLGVVGMNINRDDMYVKELDFIMSTSYGPGRYDTSYEEKGIDYPYAYVRWTENRNMSEYLRLISDGGIELENIIDKTFPVEDVANAYDYVASPTEKPLLVLLSYGNFDIDRLDSYAKMSRTVDTNEIRKRPNGIFNIALVGAGGFATSMHLPNIKSMNSKFRLYAVMNRTGHKAKVVAEQYGATIATTDYDEILSDDNVDLVLITTRHDSHAAMVLQALEAGKHVVVEKPLATNQKELDPIKKFYQQGEHKKPILFVGFNRRFSKYAREIKLHTDKRTNPLFLRYRMNAGYIPLDVWVHEDGGRIVGECCHIIDLMTYFTGSKIVSISVESMSSEQGKYCSSDNKSISLKYSDGSIASIDYFANGNTGLSKENLEVHFDDKSIVMDDYKSLRGYGLKVSELKAKVSEKGVLEELNYLYASLAGNNESWPIECWDLIQTTEASFLINEH